MDEIFGTQDGLLAAKIFSAWANRCRWIGSEIGVAAVGLGYAVVRIGEDSRKREEKFGRECRAPWEIWRKNALRCPTGGVKANPPYLQSQSRGLRKISWRRASGEPGVGWWL